jgi:hypothetical protein
MTLTIRTRLALFVALFVLQMSAGSDQLLAQGSPGAGKEEQPPAGAQQMPQIPPGGMNAAAGKKDQFEQGNVKIGGGDDAGVGSGEALQSMLPYIALIVVIVIGAGFYFMKKSSGAPARPASQSSEPPAAAPAAEARSADPEPIADDEVAGGGDGGLGGGGDDGGIGGGSDGGGDGGGE